MDLFIKISNLKLFKNPSLILAFAYAAGQGSAFFVQMLARHLGEKELAGLFVVIISILSFCFQFGDFGNPTYLVSKFSKGESKTAFSYIKARRLVAFVICGLFSIWSYFENKYDGLWILLIGAPLIGYACAGYFGAFLEARGDYLKLAMISFLPWLCMSIGLLSFLIIDSKKISIIIVLGATLLACAVGLAVSRKALDHRSGDFNKESFSSVLPFVLSPMGGQIWGRYILFTVGSAIGLAGLGAMGMAKYIQVASILSMGFMTRPALRSYIKEIVDENKSASFIGVLRKYRNPLIFSVSITLISSVFYVFCETSSVGNVNYWIPLVFATPLTLIGQAANSANQLSNDAKYVLLTDYSCLLFNVLVFLCFVEYSPVWAIVFGESAQAVMLIVFYFLLKNKMKKI